MPRGRYEDGGWKMEDGTLHRRAILHLLSSILVLIFSGCAAVGVIAHKVAGPAKIPAKYTPAQTPMLVLVENRRNTASSSSAQQLGEQIEEELLANKVAPLVANEKLVSLRDEKGKDFAQMSIMSVGRAVGASQVLYVQIIEDTVMPTPGGTSLQGNALIRVKLVDVASGATLYPMHVAEGHELAASVSVGSAQSRGSTREVRMAMCLSLADQTAKLFYKWQPEDERPEEMR